MPMRDAASTVTAFYTAIEQGRHGDQLGEYLAEDATTIERPNVLVPAGRVSDRAAKLAASAAGASLLTVQRYEVHSLREIEDTVAVRLTWRGTVAAEAGPFHAGQELTAHIAQFVKVRDGRIVEIETYDCYEPFS